MITFIECLSRTVFKKKYEQRLGFEGLYMSLLTEISLLNTKESRDIGKKETKYNINFQNIRAGNTYVLQDELKLEKTGCSKDWTKKK